MHERSGQGAENYVDFNELKQRTAAGEELNLIDIFIGTVTDQDIYRDYVDGRPDNGKPPLDYEAYLANYGSYRSVTRLRLAEQKILDSLEAYALASANDAEFCDNIMWADSIICSDDRQRREASDKSHREAYERRHNPDYIEQPSPSPEQAKEYITTYAKIPFLLGVTLKYAASDQIEDPKKVAECLGDIFITSSVAKFHNRMSDRLGRLLPALTGDQVLAASRARSWPEFAEASGLAQTTDKQVTLATALLTRFMPNYYKRFNSSPVALAHSPITPENFDLFDGLEHVLATEPPNGMTKLMSVGMEKIVELAVVVQAEAGDELTNAGIVHSAFMNKLSSDEGLSFSHIVGMANQLNQTVSAQANVEPGRPITISEIPKAIDRIVYFILHDSKRKPGANEDLYQSVAHCASLLVATGSFNKATQKVLTLGDLIIRYPDASASEIQSISDSMQKSRSESAAHYTYRDLRARRKSHAFYNLSVRGYGLLG